MFSRAETLLLPVVEERVYYLDVFRYIIDISPIKLTAGSVCIFNASVIRSNSKNGLLTREI